MVTCGRGREKGKALEKTRPWRMKEEETYWFGGQHREEPGKTYFRDKIYLKNINSKLQNSLEC